MKEYTGGCHCGAIRFAFHSEESAQIWKCNCSICDMIDYDHLFIKHDLFKLTSGKELIENTFLKQNLQNIIFVNYVASNLFISLDHIQICIVFILSALMTLLRLMK